MQLTNTVSRLRNDRSAVALLEFALSLPVVLALGLYGIETANLALMNLRVSQVALNLADSASRLGLSSALASQQLREIDMNDGLAGAKSQGVSWGLTTRGRIIVSSLENSGGVQRIHWQRCIGLRSGSGYDSSYGTTKPSDGTDTSGSNKGTPKPGGMGDPGSEVDAPPDSGVIFVEVNYEYKPVVSAQWLPDGTTRLHYIASFIVRDRRDFAQIYNPAPAATRMTCDKHTG